MTKSQTRALIEQKLALYQRYAVVVEEQTTALEEGDLDRFSELNVTRRTIEAEVEAVALSPHLFPDGESLEAIKQAVATLTTVKARQERLEGRLKEMRRQVRDEIGDVGVRRRELRSYLSGGESQSRIDVRS